VSLHVVVPAYNAASHLPGVIERLSRAAPPDLQGITVVDDGSRDHTAEVATRLSAVEPRLRLIRRTHNGGYGAAMKDGLAAARQAGATTAASIHADGQYSPEVLGQLVRELEGRGLDLLQGSRIASGTALSGGMPLYKYLANAGLNRLENLTLGLGLTDYHSGYLVYGPRALAQIAFGRLSDSFDFDLEVIASARAAGLRVGEAPIPTHYGDEVSHLRPLHYGLRVLRVLWRYRRGEYRAS
jgi:glycosyltransferase involved in cell wall biosynthesis